MTPRRDARASAEALGRPEARQVTIDAVLAAPRLGATLRAEVAAHLGGLHPDDLALVLIAGLAHEELRQGSGLVYRLMDRHAFIVDPLPNLLFTRDSSVWIKDRVAVTSLAMPARVRESYAQDILDAIDLERVRARRFRVAIPQVMRRRLSCKVEVTSVSAARPTRP